MGNNSTGMGTGKAILLTIGIMLCIGWIISLGTPKCQKSGCHNDAKEGSSYCYLHDNSYYTHKSYSSSCKGSSAGSSTSKDSGSSFGSSSSSKKRGSNYSSGKSVSGSGSSATTDSQSNSSSGSSSTKDNKRYEDTYDKGYEDVYEDDDYDLDRYNSDSDYANGVDDALDDLEEEGEEW